MQNECKCNKPVQLQEILGLQFNSTYRIVYISTKNLNDVLPDLTKKKTM